MRALTSPLRPRACSRRLHSLQLRAAAAPASAATWAQAPSATPDVVRDRAKAALLGAVLADAATMPLHWHYDQGQIKRKVLREDDGPLQTLLGVVRGDASAPLDLDSVAPEFHSPSTNLFYTYPVGRLSPYGEEAAVLIRSLASEGRLAPAAYAASSAAAYSAYPGRLNSLSKRFLERWAAGERWPSCGVAGDTQAHSLVRVPAVVARYAAVGAAELREQVADAVRVHQADQAAADYAGALALLLQRIVRGASAADALKWAAFAPEDSCPMYDDNRKEVATALAEIDGDPRAVAARFGLSCSLPGPWLGGLAIVFANGGDFKRSVRANIWAGGDSCSRAAVVGSLAGAAAGTAGLPADWIARVDDWAELEKAADKIVGDANYV